MRAFCFDWHDQEMQSLETLSNDLCERVLEASDESAIVLVDAFILASGVDACLALCSQTTRRFEKTGRFGATVLHVVCERGLVATFDYILSLCSSLRLLDARMDDGATALYLTTGVHVIEKQRAALYIARTLIERGADCSIYRSYRGASPLYGACQNNMLDCARFMVQHLLDKGGVTRDNYLRRDMQLYIRDVMLNSIIGSSILHASVIDAGKRGPDVCRWLTSPECAILWPLGSLSRFVNHEWDFKWVHPLQLNYSFTPLRESVMARLPCVQVIRHLIELDVYKGRAEDTASYILQDLVGMLGTRKGTNLSTDITVVECLYEKASRLADFASCQPGLALSSIFSMACKWVCSHKNVHAIAQLIRGLVGAYPTLFSKLRLQATIAELLVAISRPIHTGFTVCAMIYLDWIPYDVKHFKILFDFKMRSGTIVPVDACIMLHFVRRLTWTAGGDETSRIDEHDLYSVISASCPDSWSTLVSHIIYAHRGESRALLARLAHNIVHGSGLGIKPGLRFNANTVRFLLWAHHNEILPRDFRITSVIYRCPPCCSSALFEYLWRCRSPDIVRLDGDIHAQLLGTIVWNTTLKPTQIIARIFVGGARRQGHIDAKTFTKHILWVYNVRSLVKLEQSTGDRMVIGPKRSTTHTAPLPAAVTQTLIELLWRGEAESLHANLTLLPGDAAGANSAGAGCIDEM